MIEVKAAALTLAAAAVFLIATMLGIGSGMRRNAAVPGPVRVGSALTERDSDDAVPVSPVGTASDEENPRPRSVPPSESVATDNTDPALFLPPPAQLPSPGAPLTIPPASPAEPALPEPPPGPFPSPTPAVSPPLAAEVPAAAPTPASETVTRPVQTGQVNEFDDDDDTASSGPANTPPSGGSSEPGSGKSGRGSGRPGSGPGK